MSCCGSFTQRKSGKGSLLFSYRKQDFNKQILLLPEKDFCFISFITGGKTPPIRQNLKSPCVGACIARPQNKRTVEDASPYGHGYSLHQAVGVGALDDPPKANGGTKAPPYGYNYNLHQDLPHMMLTKPLHSLKAFEDSKETFLEKFL